MKQSRLSHQSFQSKIQLPQNEQWGVIYKHRANELEKARSLQKIATKQTKEELRQHLNEQVIHKINSGQIELKQDVKYYQYITQKIKEMKEKEQREKINKYVKRKQIEQFNRKMFEETLTPRKISIDNPYKLDIGLQSEIEKQQRVESIKKDMVPTLDQQLQQKQSQKQRLRRQEIEQFQRNQLYLKEQFENRTKKYKKYEQNEAVYNYYHDIFSQKMRRDKQIEHKFVDQVQQRKNEQESLRDQHDLLIKKRKTLEMKDTLQRQVDIVNSHKIQEKMGNPQQVSYSFINDVFKERKNPYDKREYSRFLERQVEEQKMNKLQHRYMSEEEYKINSNQLNRALSGNYTFEKYQDRSMNSLGDKFRNVQVEPLRGNDANIIKNKLDELRNARNRSMMQTRREADYNFS